MTEKLIISHNMTFFEKLKFPLSIGIVGESASGKSTITEDLVKVLSQYWTINRLNTDDYYYDRSEEVKKAGSFAAWAKDKDLDSPNAMDLNLLKQHIDSLKKGNDTWLPKYDMSGSAIRYDKFILARPSEIIISEGLFTMCIKDSFDICIYIDINQQLQKERWYERANYRKLGDSADIMYKNANDKANIYIRPFKSHCDLVISGEGPRSRYTELLKKFLIKINRKDKYAFTRSNFACL